jgi:hypothetical protein
MSGPRQATQVKDWVVERLIDLWGEDVFVDKSRSGANAEGVKQRGQNEPEEPANRAGTPRAGGVSLSFDLVCGLFVHTPSLRQQ